MFLVFVSLLKNLLISCMKILFKITIIIVFIFTKNQFFSQISSNKSVFAKLWSKDLTLNMAKLYLVQNVVSIQENEERLVLDGLSASTSGELTAICYSGDSAKTVGILLAFYGDYWTEQGVNYKGYAFKNLNPSTALKFLEKIIDVSEKNQVFMEANLDKNNIIFTFDDIVVIMFNNGPIKLRILWQNFDAEWTLDEVYKTLKRFETFIKK